MRLFEKFRKKKAALPDENSIFANNRTPDTKTIDENNTAFKLNEMYIDGGVTILSGKSKRPKFELKPREYYKGKKFSILGDSISTLEGCNPEGYKVFYCGGNAIKAGVTKPENTWWGKVIDYYGGELLVNNSWSGSRVTTGPQAEVLFLSACSDERTGGLHSGDVMPDVIIVYIGTNDWANGVELKKEIKEYYEENGTREYQIITKGRNESYFENAYGIMLNKIKENYPLAEIWCCTLCKSYMSSDPGFAFPVTFGGKHIEEYNREIKRAADFRCCRIIDLYSFDEPYDSIDGSHPNEQGMSTLAKLICESE